MSPTLQVAHLVAATEAEGPGRRFAVWLQGCPLRCPGCCNPEMLPLTGGRAIRLDDLCQELQQARAQEQIEGLTLLGGEPFAQAQGAADLAARAQQFKLSVMIFSGYTLGQLQAMSDPHVARLLAHTDILVDGPYLREQPETRRRWIGSANQQVHFLTERCRAADPRWLLPNTLELRLHGGVLSVNGFPALHAKDFWHKLPLHKTSD